MDAAGIKNPSIIIDASHDNCLFHGKKDHKRQSHILLEVLESIQHRPELKQLVKGFMIESFLKEGNQKLNTDHPSDLDLNGLSITDPCLSFDQTEEILLKIAQRQPS